MQITGKFSMQICGGFHANTQSNLIYFDLARNSGSSVRKLNLSTEAQHTVDIAKPLLPIGNTRKKTAQAGKACAGKGKVR